MPVSQSSIDVFNGIINDRIAAVEVLKANSQSAIAIANARLEELNFAIGVINGSPDLTPEQKASLIAQIEPHVVAAETTKTSNEKNVEIANARIEELNFSKATIASDPVVNG